MLKHIQLCESEGLGAKSGAEKKDIKSFFGAVSSAPTSASSVSSGGGKPTILSGDLNVAHEEVRDVTFKKFFFLCYMLYFTSFPFLSMHYF
jgi:hypothetical protein